jgi:ubiquinone/menaquinone biosynthesis C-methylase UbiE
MPERLWARLGLRRGETVVDVGAGSGFYSFPAAARVGPTGHVFAVDVSSDLVELLRSRADEKKVGNLEAVLSTATRIPLEDAVADVAILANLLHGIPSRTVDETIRVLRPGGKLVNVDWKKEPSEGGPAVRHRLSATMARRVLTSHGLAHVDSFDLGPSHYAQVFERPRPVRHPGHLVSAE